MEILGPERLAVHVREAHGRDRREPVVQLLRIADDHDGQRVTTIDPLRRRAGAERRDRRQPLAVQLQVIGRQPQQLRLGDNLGDLLWRLDREREGAHQEALGVAQLGVRDRLGADAVDLVQHFGERTVGHFGATLERPQPEADAAVAPQPGVGAVGPALLLPQDQEQPGVRPAAQHLRGDASGIVAGIGGGERGVADHDVGLDRPRPIDEQNIRARLGRRRGRQRDGRRRAGPAAERGPGEGLRLIERQVSRHDEQRPRGAEATAGEGDHILAGDAPQRLRGGAASIGIATVDLPGEEPARHAPRLRQLELQPRQGTGACELHLVRGEGGVAGDVSQELERQIRAVAQHVGRHGQDVRIGRGAEAPACALDLRGDLLRGPRCRSLGHQLGRQPGEAFLAVGIVNVTRPEAQRHRDHRLLVVLDDHHPQAARQQQVLERGETRGAERSGAGGPGGEGILGGQSDCRAD